MTKEQMSRELLDNALCLYLEVMGTDHMKVDFSTFDEWLEDETGKVNPLEEYYNG